MEYVVFCLLGYLFGSVTFGYLIPRLIKGVDVRALSSDGNPGTANAFLYGGVFCGILGTSGRSWKKALCRSFWQPVIWTRRKIFLHW